MQIGLLQEYADWRNDRMAHDMASNPRVFIEERRQRTIGEQFEYLVEELRHALDELEQDQVSDAHDRLWAALNRVTD